MSIASQLKAIRAAAGPTSQPLRHPIARPTLIFDPKEAADIDTRTILPVSLSGLEVLINVDRRFAKYKQTLFSQTSLELDREKMVPQEEANLNTSINSYLRLLSGHLQLPAALNTLEYLVRKYLVHVYNVEELILCALPYHDTHVFVRIVQLLNLGNNKWAFLEGVKVTGAPPPRKIIVQQCIRDKGVLEALCTYAAPTKEFQHSGPVICFCTAVIVEALGAIAELEEDTKKRVLGFVFDGLNPAMKGGRDHKAGALMVVGLLATKAILGPDLVQNLLLVIARVAQQDASEFVDLPWLRVTIMAMVTLVQLQFRKIFPRKTVMVLKEVRDLPGVLAGLSNEFNIQIFLGLYLESLLEYSMYSDSADSCLSVLCEMLSVLPVKDHVENIVCKGLASCMKKVCRGKTDSDLCEAGSRLKKILMKIDEQFSCELHAAVRKFMEENLSEENSVAETFFKMFDDSNNTVPEIPDSKIWFSLEHPKAMVRQTALSEIANSGLLKTIAGDSKRLGNIRYALMRALDDEDITVVRAALSIDGLAGFIHPPSLFKAYCDILQRCIGLINKNMPKSACDVSVLCLERLVLDFDQQSSNYSRDIAITMFPLLLVLPKTWRLNLKALDLVRQVKWPFYTESLFLNDVVQDFNKNPDHHHVASINTKTIGVLAEVFARDPLHHISWLIDCSKCNGVSKSLFLFIMLQGLMQHAQRTESGSSQDLHEACFPVARNEWRGMKITGYYDSLEEINFDELDNYYVELVNSLSSVDTETLNRKIIICIFWCLLKPYRTSGNHNTTAGDSRREIFLEELFLFFAESPTRNVFRKHMQFLVINCTVFPLQFLSKYFSEKDFPIEVQVESLNMVATICSLYLLPEGNNLEENNCLQLLLGFPLLLVPLASCEKDVRASTLKCIEGLYGLWRHFDVSRLRNGNDSIVAHCVSSTTFGNFLEAIISQKKMICSDATFLSSYLTSMLSSSSNNLMVPSNIHERFDQPAKEAILFVILSSALMYPPHGKLAVLSLLKEMGASLLKIEGIKTEIVKLLERRSRLDKSLSKDDISTLCLFLEVCVHSSSAPLDADAVNYVLKALQVHDLPIDEPVSVRPCVVTLQKLNPLFFDNLKSEKQDEIFANLVSLFRFENVDIRNESKEALLRIKVTCSNVVRFLKFLSQDNVDGSTKRMKKSKELSHRTLDSYGDIVDNKSKFDTLISLLDILLLKKNIDNRISLVKPLLKVLTKLFSKDCVLSLLNEDGMKYSEVPESLTGSISLAQQTTLLILKDIADSHLSPVQDRVFSDADMNSLVGFARSAGNFTTRNYIFLLISSVAKASSEWISEHIVDIFSAIGEYAIKQNDGHSQYVMEELISTLVPCWLSKTKSVDKLFQIFIKALPDVAEHRRLALIASLLRALGEETNLGILINQLLISLVCRNSQYSHDYRGNINDLVSSSILHEWEFMLAEQVCNQYTCKLWFPSLVKVLQELKMLTVWNDLVLGLHLAMQFILCKLQDTELVFELESEHGSEYLQITLGALLEEIVLYLQLVWGKSRPDDVHSTKDIKDTEHKILISLTSWMVPSTFFGSITKLLQHADVDVKKKALGVLCEIVKDGLVQNKDKYLKKIKQRSITFPHHIDESTRPSFHALCSGIVELIDASLSDSKTSVKVSAISSLEVLSKKFPSEHLVFGTALSVIVKHIVSDDCTISSVSIRTAGALIGVLGSKALPQLPLFMKHIIKRFHSISTCSLEKHRSRKKERSSVTSGDKIPIVLSLLTTLELVVEQLSGFLNPYLEDILDILALHPEYTVQLDPKISMKADSVRKLLTMKIPVRLLITPLLQAYSKGLERGESSLCLIFNMLANMIEVMDRGAIGTYHVRIFEHCLLALDLRRQHPETVDNIDMVEQSVTHAMVVLTMKLTESMFRPLFLHSLDWAESEFEETKSMKSRSLDRTISFYNLLYKLTEQHRSLFVPYFKYLLESCVRHLTASQQVEATLLTQKKKKAKVGDACTQTTDKSLSPKQWHLRALIIKSLYKCFLYDTDLKVLDSSNFQVLLKALVCQLTVDPPSSVESSDLPQVDEVDESLVMCLGQMAVTVRSDVLWKPLNHEVLMQTRNEKIRPRILGLRVVKFLIDHLKEEYLVFLAETIPFLAELLEDVELPVKTLAQDILKEMETLSGESLRQYL